MYRQSIQFPIKDAALREDVHALGGLIGETLRDQGGEEFFELVEGDRVAALQRREGDARGAAELDSRTAGRSPAAATAKLPACGRICRVVYVPLTMKERSLRPHREIPPRPVEPSISQGFSAGTCR